MTPSGVAVCLRSVIVLGLLLGTAPAVAKTVECPGNLGGGAYMTGVPEQLCFGDSNMPDMSNPPECGGSGCGFVINCRTPTVEGPIFDVVDAGDGTFTARLKFVVTAPPAA